ncbi:MAG: bile acid:sodium symporter [Planctomycetaceae bacterium]|nr:bile acid:sodium symporter [Planctomycetaceae bacterium]
MKLFLWIVCKLIAIIFKLVSFVLSMIRENLRIGKFALEILCYRNLKSVCFSVRPNIVWFLGMAIFLAYVSPQVGANRVVGQIAGCGFWVMFFCYGIGMNPAIVKNEMANWKLHVIIQLITFLIFPIIVLVVRHFFVTELTQELWLGIFYTSVLPSTVSSSVVMVSLAGGNITAAIFNASISGIIGVFVTPIWMSLFITNIANTNNFSVISAIRDLLIIIVLPLGVGMCFNRRLSNFAARNRKYLKYFDQSVILLVVYTSFSKSFAGNAFAGFTISQLVFLCIGMLLLFFCVYGITLVCCRAMRFNNTDTITALFCCSKKSLVHGITMSKVIFAGMTSVGILLLPIMLYHALQLIVVSIIVKYFADSTKNRPFR